jgi:adenylate cyclase
MDRLIIAVLVLALGYFAFDKFVLTPRREAVLIATN